MAVLNKSISVWLILLDGKNKGKFALQKRTDKNKSFQFICQATWAGKLEKNEELLSAIERECQEELGEKFCNSFDFDMLKLKSKDNYEMNANDWEDYNFMGEVEEKTLSFAKLHENAFPDFIFIDKTTAIYPLNLNQDPKNNIVLFNDKYKFLTKLWK